MLTPILFAISAFWPPEVLAKLWRGVEGEVRPPWNPKRS